MDRAAFAKDLRHFGARRALIRALYWRARAGSGIAVYRLVLLRAVDLDPELVRRSADPSIRRLDAEEIAAFSQDPANHLPPAFVQDALARGDVCVAVLDGARLASFGWYATRATIVENGCAIRFDDRLAYMYHGYTKPEYRGRNMHGLGLSHAMRVFADRGYHGILGLAEYANYASLISAHRVGFRNIGFGMRMKRRRAKRSAASGAGELVLKTSRGARRHGIRLEAAGLRLYASEQAANAERSASPRFAKVR